MNVLRHVCVIGIVMATLSSYAQNVRVEKHLAGKNIKGLNRESGALHFLVVGDWGRNGQGDQQKVSDWMGVAATQVNAQFVISTGDNFYCCGVASTSDYQWLSSFENVYRSHSLQIPWYITLGNHDYQGNVQAQIDYTYKSQRWKLPYRYYTKVIQGVQFIFIDTTPFVKGYYSSDQYPDLVKQDTARQLQWLDSVLLHSSQKWKIVVGHHPVYSRGDHGNEQDMLEKLKPRLEKYNVAAYFAGHDHSLQSLQEKGKKVHYLISGGGAERTHVKEETSITHFALNTTGFMAVSLSDNVMQVYFISGAGKIIYKEIIQIHSS